MSSRRTRRSALLWARSCGTRSLGRGRHPARLRASAPARPAPRTRLMAPCRWRRPPGGEGTPRPCLHRHDGEVPAHAPGRGRLHAGRFHQHPRPGNGEQAPPPWALEAALAGLDAVDETAPLVGGKDQLRPGLVLGVPHGGRGAQVGYLYAATVAAAIGALAPERTGQVGAWLPALPSDAGHANSSAAAVSISLVACGLRAVARR